MSADRSRVFSIPPGAAFLPTLADALFDGTLIPGWPDATDPLALSAGTIFVPTRRAARALATLIAERAAQDAVLLPRIVPLGDVDAAEEAQIAKEIGASLDLGSDLREATVLPPQVIETTRRLVLARLVQAWAKALGRDRAGLEPGERLLVPASPADALAMAGDLGMLIDTLAIHGRTVEDIHALVPGEYSQYWDISRDFLGIAARTWPDWCAELGVMDAATRRHKLLIAEAERLCRDRPDAPMIVAGSTGSMPATAALIHAIASLPRGAVVLPGLDRHLDEAAWLSITRGEEVHPSHPQSVLAGLMPGFRLLRSDVRLLGTPTAELAARELFLSEALRPAETTHLWSQRHTRLDPETTRVALAGIAIVEAADDREEATTIAVILREAIEDPRCTAALITPDRTLAARVSAELRRWNIRVDDSAGQALGQSPAGLLARLVAHAAVEDFEAQALLALVAHPLCRVGLPRATVERARVALEIGVLRGPALERGLSSLKAAIPAARMAAQSRRAPRPRQRLGPDDWAALLLLLDSLEAAFAGLTISANAGPLSLTDLPAAHEAVLMAVVSPAPGEDALFTGPDAEGIVALFDELREAGPIHVDGVFDDYPAFFEGLLAGRVVRRAGDTHPRVRIWGLLEARLLPCDVAVLGALDEKTWPAETHGDAFLNRPMRRDLGLPAPERRIGQMAHDFSQALGAPRVVITRALKRGGDPSVASRFVQRMEAVAGKDIWKAVVARGARSLALARLLDQTGPARPVSRPRPLVPAERVPMRLSVTEIETLVRDPYAIFAKHVLGLDPLDPVASAPDAAVRGTLVHEVMNRFVRAYPDALPPDPVGELLAIGKGLFAETPELRDHPDIAAAWWPRFERMAVWIAQWEPRRRALKPSLHVEIPGELQIPLTTGGPFTLTARADRIECLASGAFRIVDFKTGTPPTAKVVRAGFSPQLTLEAAMVKRGAFNDIPAERRADELVYVKLSGGSVAGKETPIRDNKTPVDVDALADEHYDGLVAMMSEYASGLREFKSRPYAQYARRYAPYDHLARVREWSLVGQDDEGGGA